MPFGLKNAPTRFQRYVNEVLNDLIINGDVVVYMDDFLIATDTLEKHFEVLDRIFRLLTQNRLELRLDKCRFFLRRNRVSRLCCFRKGRATE